MKWKAKLAMRQCSETKSQRTKKLMFASVDANTSAVYDASECKVLSQCSRVVPQTTTAAVLVI